MRRLFVLVLLGILLAPLAAFAQEDPPLPRPRIDREKAEAARTVLDDETGLDQDSPALKALADALRARGQSPAGPVPSGPPQPVTLSAKISDDGVVIPDGLTWRIFDSRVDESGQLALLAKSEKAVAVFNLPPGEYLVHVAYGRSQASDTLDVTKGVNNKTIVLDSGGLRLNAAITGDIPIAAADLRFEIYTTGDNEQDRVLVAQNVAPGDVVHLNAGVYQIVSHFGKLNAEVKADLRVDPGQLTDATLYHKARKISLKLVSEEGGEAIADVDWTVKDSSGNTIYTYFGAFPGCVLANGSYSVLARRGDTVYNRDFSVTPGKPQEIEVLTSVYKGEPQSN